MKIAINYQPEVHVCHLTESEVQGYLSQAKKSRRFIYWMMFFSVLVVAMVMAQGAYIACIPVTCSLVYLVCRLRQVTKTIKLINEIIAHGPERM